MRKDIMKLLYLIAVVFNMIMVVITHYDGEIKHTLLFGIWMLYFTILSESKRGDK